MTHLLLLCGSQREGSLNARLLDEIAALVPPTISMDRVRSDEIGLPLFEASLESDPAVRKHVEALHRRFAAADAIILASPEYNGLMTPFLKNVIDWVSRMPRLDGKFANAFLDRPVLLCSATPGWSGGSLGIAALRTLFGYVGAIPFGETICLPFANQAWEDDGQLKPDLADLGWSHCVARFSQFASRQQLGKAA